MGKGGRVLLPNGRSSSPLESRRSSANELGRADPRLSNVPSTRDGESHEAGRSRGTSGVSESWMTGNLSAYPLRSNVSKGVMAALAPCMRGIGIC